MNYIERVIEQTRLSTPAISREKNAFKAPVILINGQIH